MNREALNIKLPETIAIEIRGQLLLIGLNRPEKRNAINDELLLVLEKIVDQIPEQIKCAIIYGEGPDFSAGLDLSELKETDAVQGLYHSRMWCRVMEKIQFGKTPVIAVLQGAVLGGGLELASACHIRISEESAYFGLPEGKRGIFTGGGASVRIPKLIGLARMTDMMLTGRIYQSVVAEKIGLVQYLVPDGEGMKKSLELADIISTNTEMTNFAVLQALPRINESNADHGGLLESLMASIAQNSTEAKQRLRDFLEGIKESF